MFRLPLWYLNFSQMCMIEFLSKLFTNLPSCTNLCRLIFKLKTDSKKMSLSISKLSMKRTRRISRVKLLKETILKIRNNSK